MASNSNPDSLKERLKVSCRNITRTKSRLLTKRNYSHDLKVIQTLDRKIEMLNIVRYELKILIRQL